MVFVFLIIYCEYYLTILQTNVKKITSVPNQLNTPLFVRLEFHIKSCLSVSSERSFQIKSAGLSCQSTIQSSVRNIQNSSCIGLLAQWQLFVSIREQSCQSKEFKMFQVPISLPQYNLIFKEELVKKITDRFIINLKFKSCIYATFSLPFNCFSLRELKK